MSGQDGRSRFEQQLLDAACAPGQISFADSRNRENLADP